MSADAHSPSREGQTFAGRTAFVRYANLVKLPHTVFALPFALVGVVLASYVKDVTLGAILWVALAFTSARFAAMAFNRIVDRRLDALNPRTASREIPAGLVTVRGATAAVVVASAALSCRRRGDSTRSASPSRRSRWPGCSATATPSASLAGRTSCSGSASESLRLAAISPSRERGAIRGGCSRRSPRR